MKNIIKLIGIIALVAVIGFSFTACGDDDDDNGGGGGTFTLTDIPSEYNGNYVAFIIDQDGYGTNNAWGSTDEDGWANNWPRISNGRVSIPLWAYDPDNATGFTRYTLTETLSCSGYIVPKDGIFTSYLVYFEFYSISFTNGNATKSWNDIDNFGY
jgi:hypothetical protein